MQESATPYIERQRQEARSEFDDPSRKIKRIIRTKRFK